MRFGNKLLAHIYTNQNDVMKPYLYLTLLCIGFVMNCKEFVSTEEFNRSFYISSLANSEREFHAYLPKGYHSQETKKWPAILFLLGDGERGDSLYELAYTRIHIPYFNNEWNRFVKDLSAILEKTINELREDSNKIYLTELSHGGFETWYFGYKYPDKFASITSFVAWGHPQIIPPIAQHNQLI